MLKTTNYNLNLVEGTDTVNPLVDTNPNFTEIDDVMFENQNRTIQEATEVYSNGNHAITCTLPSGASFFHFTASSNFTAGDTFTFNGTSVTAFLPNGQSLYTGAFVINSEVLISIIGTRMVVYTNTQTSLNSSTPCNLTNGQFLMQSNNKLSSAAITPDSIGAVKPYAAGDTVNYGVFVGAGRATTSNIVFMLPMSRPVSANSVVVSGVITIRAADGTSLLSSYDFTIAGTIDSQSIRITLPITYETSPVNYSLASVFITSLSLNFS